MPYYTYGAQLPTGFLSFMKRQTVLGRGHSIPLKEATQEPFPSSSPGLVFNFF